MRAADIAATRGHFRIRGIPDTRFRDRGDAVEALRRAQQSLRAVKRKGARPYEHPYYWAGFVISSSQP